MKSIEPSDALISINEGLKRAVQKGMDPSFIRIHPITLRSILEYLDKNSSTQSLKLTSLCGLFVLEDESIDPTKAELIDMKVILDLLHVNDSNDFLYKYVAEQLQTAEKIQ